MLTPLYRELLSSNNVVHTKLNGGQWIPVSNATFSSQKDVPPNAALEALLICNQNVVQLPSNTIWNVIETYYSNAAIVNPSLIQAHLKHNHSAYTSMGHNDKLKLLAYCLKNTQYQHMIGLKLIPLLNGSFEQFNAQNQGYYVKSNVYYVCTASNRPSLLPAMSHCLVDLYDTNRSLHNLLLKVAESGLTQLKVLEDKDVAKLLPQCNPESWSEQQRKKFWDWLRNKNLALFTNRHIVPVSSNSIMPLAKAGGVVYASKFGLRAQSSHVLTALDKLGIKIADASVFTYLEHREILNYLYHFEAGDILDALNGIAIPQCTLSDSQAISLQQFFSNASLNGQRINAICELPIFSTIQGEGHRSSITSLKPNYYSSAIVEGEHFDFSKKHLPSSPLVISSQGNVSSLLSKLTGQVRIMNGMEYLQEYVFPDIQCGHLSAGSKALMKDIISNYYNFRRHYGSAITTAISSLNFIPVALGKYKSPSALYDPKDSNIVELYKGKSMFPSEYNDYQSLRVLRQCGLKSTSDITAEDINDIVVDIQESCSSSPVWCGNVSYGRSKAVLLFLTKHPNLLKQSVASWYYATYTLTNKLISCAESHSWLPVSVAPPSEYPSCIPWCGSEYSDSLASTECKPLIALSGTVTNSELPIIVGSQAYFIENVPSQLCSQLRSSTDIIATSVVDHLQVVIENKSEISHDKLESMVYKIYEYLSKNITSNVIRKLKCLDKWVWVENLSSFLAPSQVAMSPNASLRNNLEPFMHVLSRRMQSYSKLLTACNVANTITSQHILSILQHIQNRTVQISKQEAWSLVRTILEWVVECEEVAVDRRMLVPVESESQYPQLKEACKVAYTDNEVFLSIAKSSDEEYTLIHPNVAHLAPKLGLTPLSDQLDITEDVFEDAGQHEPLIMRIKNILREYKDGLTIIKELIQNADDAEATEVNIVYDARNHTKENLFIQEMGESHGPALVIHNNKMFTDEDFENITKLAAATKKDKALKIGKFGIGFCSVYHMTDVPSFISRDWLYIFDPTLKHLKSVVRNESRPGKRMKYRSPFIARSSQLAPYKNLFNFNPSASYDGTIFRLPFRQHVSEISSTIYNEAMISQLKCDLSENSSKLLLFLKHVKRITFSSINESGLHMTDQLIIERHSHSDNIRTLCSTNTETNKVSNETWLISSREENLVSRNRRTYQIAMASVACKLEEGQGSSYSCASVDGGIYCFLPLNVPSTGLPVHVNANFAVRDNRSGIWTSESQYMNDQEWWNHQLMGTTIATAYCNLLLKLKQLSLQGKLSNYNFFLYWPLISKLTSLKPWDKLVESLYKLIATCTEGLFLSKSCDTWQTMDESQFLHPTVLNEGSGDVPTQCVIDAICILQLPVVFLPLSYQEQFSSTSVALDIVDEMQFVSLFFNHIDQFDTACSVRNAVLLAMFEALTVQQTKSSFSTLQQYLENYPCVPCTPNGKKLQLPNQLMDPASSYSNLFDPHDEMFPIKEFTEKFTVLSTLHSLGLMSHQLSWEVIIVCASRIEKKYKNEKKEALKRIKLIIECIDNNIPISNDNILVHVPDKLKQIPFLPVSSRPNKYPSLLQWAGDSDTLKCPCDLVYPTKDRFYYTSSIPFIVGSQRAVINVSDCGNISHHVQNALGIITQPSFDDVLAHFTNLTTMAAGQSVSMPDTDLEYIGRISRNVYEFFDNIINIAKQKNTRTQVSYYYEEYKRVEKTETIEDVSEAENLLVTFKDKPFLWTGAEFVAPCNVATKWNQNGPYLYKLPDIVAERKHLRKALGIVEQFEVTKLLHALKELKERFQDDKLPENLHDFIDAIVHELSKANPDEMHVHEADAILPDENHTLHKADGLGYNDAKWLGDCGQILVHPKLIREVALALGVKPVRGEFLKQYQTGPRGFGGVPFGQREDLTQRIKNILRDYPLNETFFKELLQNADDAKATKMYVILDKRTHASEKIPCPEWEELQGPALLVWNDANFTDKDIEGIQRLGVGSKRDDTESIGQFGIGFNVVYHITDCPSFMTGGDTLCIFDPHCRYAPGADKINPGTCYKNIDHKFWNSMAGLHSAYLQDAQPAAGQPEGLASGSLFRFPLRHTHEQVMKSELLESKVAQLQSPLTAEEMEKKLNQWVLQIKDALLFLKNIIQFQFFIITENRYRTWNGPELNWETKTKYNLEVSYEVNLDQTAIEKREKFFSSIKTFKTSPIPQVSTYILKMHSRNSLESESHSSSLQSLSSSTSTGEMHDHEERWLVQQGIGDLQNAQQKWRFIDQALPMHGIAAALNHKVPGKVFCFLPLPIHTNLPVHINGQFILSSSNRRSLWSSLEEHDEKKQWNDNLIKAISSSYVHFLCEAQNYCITEGQYSDKKLFFHDIKVFYQLFPYYHVSKSNLKLSEHKIKGEKESASEDISVEKKSLTTAPSNAQPESQWKQLAVMTFIELWKQNAPVLASEVIHVNGKKQTYAVQWHVLHNDSDLIHQAYFLPKKDDMHIIDVLKKMGMILTHAPHKLYRHLCSSEIEPAIVYPESVFNFYADFHTSILGRNKLPCSIEETCFGSLESFVTFICYIIHEDVALKESLFLSPPDELPLLLTADNKLRDFKEASNVIKSKHLNLFPNSKSMFLHSCLCDQLLSSSYFLKPEDAELNYVLQEVLATNFSCYLQNKQINNNDNHLIKSEILKELWQVLFEEDIFIKCRDNILKNWALIPSTSGWLYSTYSPVVPIIPYVDDDDDDFVNSYTNQKMYSILCQLDAPILDSDYEEFEAQKYCTDISKHDRILEILFHLNNVTSIQLKLSLEDAGNILEYLSRSAFRQNKNIKHKILSLPLFESVSGELTMLSYKDVYRWPAVQSFPKAGYATWAPYYDVTFLPHYGNWTNLCQSEFSQIGSDINEKEIYTKLIFHNFDALTNEERREHLVYIRDHLYDYIELEAKKGDMSAQDFICKLKQLPCLESPTTNRLSPIHNFYDHTVDIFSTFPEKYTFLSSEYQDEDWLEFFRKLDLQTEVSIENYKELCNYVAAGNHDDPVQASDVLLAYLFSDKAKKWYEHEDGLMCNLYDLRDIGNIPFVMAEQLHSLTWIKACQQPSNIVRNIGLTKLNEAALYEYANVIWTVKPVVKLPDGALTEEMDTLLVKLGISQKPMADDVYNNVLNISKTKLADFNLFSTYNQNFPSGDDMANIVSVIIDNIHYLCDIEATAQLELLKKVPYIPVSAEGDVDSTSILKPVLVKPLQAVHKMADDDKMLIPYINPLPRCLNKIAGLFDIIGVESDIGLCHIQHLLETMYEQRLKVAGYNTRSLLHCAIVKLYNLLLVGDYKIKEVLDALSPLYLPSSCQNMLFSENLVFLDSTRYKNHYPMYDFIGTSYSLLQIPRPVKEIRHITEKEFCLKLPPAVRPEGLSLCTQEEILHMTKSSDPCSLEKHLTKLQCLSENIKRLLPVMIMHDENIQLNQKQESLLEDFAATIADFITTASIVSVSNLNVAIILTICTPPKRICGIKAKYYFKQTEESNILYVDTDTIPSSRSMWKELAQTLCIEAARSMGIKLRSFLKYVYFVSECLQIQNEEDIKVIMEDYGAELQIVSVESDAKPIEIGDEIPQYMICRMDQDINHIFRSQEYVGYEIEDDIFILAMIQYPMMENSNSIFKTYMISVGSVDDEEVLKEVSALKLYKFVQEIREDISDDKQLVPSDDTSVSNSLRQASDSIQLQDMKEKICEDLIAILSIEPEDSRRQALKRLYLEYHPDKHIDENTELYKEAFSFLKKQIDRINDGLPLEGMDDILPQNVKLPFKDYYHKWDGSRGMGGGGGGGEEEAGGGGGGWMPPPPPEPDPEEAKRWMRQAKTDYEAMKIVEASLQSNAASVACQVAFLAHEVMEKALKAGMYHFVGQCDLVHHKLHDYSCTLRSISENAHLHILPQLTSGMERHYLYSRFPNQYAPLIAPTDVYTVEEAELAARNAEKLIDLIDEAIA